MTEGTEVRTGQAPGRILIRSGGRGSLGAASVAVVHGDRLVLKSGSATLAFNQDFEIEALDFMVAPRPGSRTRVELADHRLSVAALDGPVAVHNRAGVLLARVEPGAPLSFEPPSGDTRTSTATGRLEKSGDVFFVRDELTGVRYELRGDVKELAAHVGRRVQVTGETQSGAAGGTAVIQVAKVERAAAKSAGGLSHGAKIGLATLAAGAGAAAATLGAISR